MEGVKRGQESEKQSDEEGGMKGGETREGELRREERKERYKGE